MIYDYSFFIRCDYRENVITDFNAAYIATRLNATKCSTAIASTNRRA